MSSSKMGLRAGDLQHLLEKRQEVRRQGGNLPLKLLKGSFLQKMWLNFGIFPKVFDILKFHKIGILAGLSALVTGVLIILQPRIAE